MDKCESIPLDENGELFYWFDKAVSDKKRFFLEIHRDRIILCSISIKDSVVRSFFYTTYVAEKEENSFDSENMALTQALLVTRAFSGRPESLEGRFLQLLKHCEKCLGYRPTRLYILLPGATTFNQVNSLPEMNRRDLKLALKNEIQSLEKKRFQNKAVSTKTFPLGTLDLTGKPRKYFLLCSASQESVARYMRLLRKNNISCQGMSSVQLLYIYHFNSPHAAQKESTIFVDASEETLHILFFCQNTLAFIRSLSLGKTNDEKSFVQVVASQIEQSMLYFSQQNGDVDFDRFILQNNSSYKNAAQKLADVLGFPVDAFLYKTNPLPGPVQQLIECNHLPCNVQLYKNVIENHKVKLALIPKEFDEALQQRMKYASVFVFLSLWFFTVFGCYKYLAHIVGQREKQLQQITFYSQKKNHQKGFILSRKKTLESTYATMKKDRPFQHRHHLQIQKILDMKFMWATLLQSVLHHKQKSIFLQRIALFDMDLEEQKVELFGRIRGSYQQALQNFETFKRKLQTDFEIASESIQQQQGGNGFSMNLLHTQEKQK